MDTASQQPQRHRGEIIHWNADRGFGFIARPHRPDLFVHCSAIANHVTGDDWHGEIVEYEVDDHRLDAKLRAIKVRRVHD